MNLEELKKRRLAFVSLLSDDSVAILSSANKNFRTRDVENLYRQDSDFLYMNAISEPNLINVIYKKNNNIFSVLFRNNTSFHEKIWDGSRLDNNEIKNKYGFTEINDYENYKERILSYLKGKKALYIEFGLNKELDNLVYEKVLSSAVNNRHNEFLPKKIITLSEITHKLRLIKSPYEIDLIKKAAKVSIRAHEKVMKEAKVGMFEYELDAEIKYEFNKNNMNQAYIPIVGSGNNACILHYIKNNDKLKNNDLVLVDAAAEYQGYASDITRTFPVNGKFTKEQAMLYDVVLSAQEKTIDFIKPGVTWDQVHQVTVEEISKGLIKLNLISENIDNVLKNHLYKDFFMHKTGHWLGLDVHDVGEYEKILFRPGMVITVEPGIYINSFYEKVPEEWRGIGIRIEDDVLITENGNEVITKDLAKKRHEIEAICTRSNDVS